MNDQDLIIAAPMPATVKSLDPRDLRADLRDIVATERVLDLLRA